jgi:very-short-patch-repair endonuclease
MLDIVDIVDMYVEQDCSTYVIAKKYDTYPNKIRRLLIKNGVQLDDKSEAQKKALKSGRSKHPTEGTKRSEEVKTKISESVYTNWQNLTPEEREQRSEKAREQWNNMSLEERKALREAAAQAVREASKKGSKMERFLLDNLRSKGYNILFHQEGIIPNENLEIDLFVPELKTVIEIDGPSHFFPIWGETDVEREANLQRQIKSDAHKSGLLLAQGFVIIRIKHLARSLSQKHQRDALGAIVEALENIREKFPTKSKRYIELEVS